MLVQPVLVTRHNLNVLGLVILYDCWAVIGRTNSSTGTEWIHRVISELHKKLEKTSLLSVLVWTSFIGHVQLQYT